MASSSNTFQPLRQPLAHRLKNALDVYGHITPPNEEDDGDCTRFIGRCLVEINEEQRRNSEHLQMIEHNPRESSFDGPTFSSQNDKIEGIWEEIGEVKSKVDKIEDKVQDVEDKLISMENKGDEQYDHLSGEIGDVEGKVDSLAGKVDTLEGKVQDVEDKLISMENKGDEQYDHLLAEIGDVEGKVDTLESRFDTLGSRFDAFERRIDARFLDLQARLRNGTVSRFYERVRPTGMSYIDMDGKLALKMPTWPVKKVSYYWKMHNRKNHQKLINLLHFYQVDFRHWAFGDDELSDDESSDDSDDLDLPVTTLEQAVSMYPDRAVIALFYELGLVYSRFQEKVERASLRPTVLQKRSPKDTSSELEHRVKRRSDRSTTELLGSSTASESVSQ